MYVGICHLCVSCFRVCAAEGSALRALKEKLYAHRSELMAAFQQYDIDNTGWVHSLHICVAFFLLSWSVMYFSLSVQAASLLVNGPWLLSPFCGWICRGEPCAPVWPVLGRMVMWSMNPALRISALENPSLRLLSFFYHIFLGNVIKTMLINVLFI